MKITFNFLLIFLTMICISSAASGQRLEIKPFSIDRSDLIRDLKAAKAANPKIATAEFVDTANSLLEKQGINFVVAFDAATCLKISQAIASLKDKTAPLNLTAALKSPLGDSAKLLLPEISFAKSECVPCFVKLPMLEATSKDFVTVVEGKNLKFFLPTNFILNEAFLVDDQNLSSIKTRWKIPFRAAPLSISDDGNILYFGFDEPELSDLVLMAYANEGGYQFAAKSDIDARKKGSALKDFPKDAANPNLSFIKFTRGEINQIVKFSLPCAN